MPFELTWMPEVLRKAGLKVAEVPGWADRGRGPMPTARGVMCHHTANANQRNMPSLDILIQGRSDLPGPLAQLGLGRDGTYYIVAAGRANHAGSGAWKGITAGNTSFIGIEAENGGTPADPWPEVQLDAYWRGTAALLTRLGAGASMCCGHKEWAPSRKPDPHSLDMNDFRDRVHRLQNGVGVIRPTIPAQDPRTNRATLRRGARGEAVRALQTKLDLGVDGIFGAMTEAAVRAFQRSHGLVPDGIVGPKTWAVLFP